MRRQLPEGYAAAPELSSAVAGCSHPQLLRYFSTDPTLDIGSAQVAQYADAVFPISKRPATHKHFLSQVVSDGSEQVC